MMSRIEYWSPAEIRQGCSFWSFFTDYTHAQDLQNTTFESFATGSEWKTWQTQKRSDLLSLLHIPQDLWITTQSECRIVQNLDDHPKLSKTLSYERIYLKSALGYLIPIIRCSPRDLSSSTPIPAVICLHGHVMNKWNLIGRRWNLVYPGAWARDFTQQGKLTLAMDSWGFGERKKAPLSERNYALSLQHYGLFLNTLRMLDVIQQVTYLIQQPEVDIHRIAVAGLSMGGLLSTFSAALDERIAAALIAGYIAMYPSSIISRVHCPDNFFFGLGQWGDIPTLLGLIAPRPVGIIHGIHDPLFPYVGTQQAIRLTQELYQRMHIPVNPYVYIHKYGHRWDSRAAAQFFDVIWSKTIK